MNKDFIKMLLFLTVFAVFLFPHGKGEAKLLQGSVPSSPVISKIPTHNKQVQESTYIFSVDRLLETCPTAEEILSIRTDFNITFDSEVADNMYDIPCTYKGTESSAQLGVYNAFRAMKLINFSSPMPYINATNLYDWLKSLNVMIHIFDGEESSHAGGNVIHLNSKAFSQEFHRFWYDRRHVCGLMDTVQLIIHEARHTTPGGGLFHSECGFNSDSSLSNGGPWALVFYYYLKIYKDKTGLFDEASKNHAYYQFNNILKTKVCD